MKLGFFITWAIHQAFGTEKGNQIIALLTGPLGQLINAASHDQAQAIVTEVNGIAEMGLEKIKEVSASASYSAVAAA